VELQLSLSVFGAGPWDVILMLRAGRVYDEVDGVGAMGCLFSC